MKGHIKQRSPGSWTIWLEMGKDAAGKRQQKVHTVRGTKRDAERELARLVHELNTGEYVEPSRLSVGEFLTQWLQDYVRPNRPQSLKFYSEIVSSNLIPGLGHYQLAKLGAMHIQAYYAQALDRGRRKRAGGLSAATVKKHHNALRLALRHAVQWKRLARNPADQAEPPKVPHKPMRVYSEDELAHILQGAEGHWIYLPTLIASTTGMRQGEVLALRWKDLDLQASTLSVAKAKTAKGRRQIALDASTVDALRRHRAAQAEERLLMGPAYQDGGLVCARPDGRPLLGSSLTHAFQALLARLAIPSGRFHDLRHAHATMLFRAGVHPKIVSERLGHATVGFSLDQYSHVLPDMQEEAARKVGLVMAAAVKRRGVDGNGPAEYGVNADSEEVRYQNVIKRAKRPRGMRARKAASN